MADFEMKKTALQLLAVNGILSQEEVDKCIDVISSDEYESKSTSGLNDSSLCSDFVFDDSNLCVTFKGMNAGSNLFFGDGIEFKFIIQNKTSHEELRESIKEDIDAMKEKYSSKKTE